MMFDFTILDNLFVGPNGQEFRLPGMWGEKDWKVNNSKWRVHLNDADPFPSKPHAHCIAGKYEGLKLNLSTGELFLGPKSTGHTVRKKEFLSICEKVLLKFPDLTFPLELHGK